MADHGRPGAPGRSFGHLRPGSGPASPLTLGVAAALIGYYLSYTIVLMLRMSEWLQASLSSGYVLKQSGRYAAVFYSPS